MRERIEALAVRDPEWTQFADRLWIELLYEAAIAKLGTIKDGPLISGTWVCEIGGVAKMYFALMDDGTEEIEDYAEWVVDGLAHLRKWVDGDGNVLWDGIEPVVWRPASVGVTSLSCDLAMIFRLPTLTTVRILASLGLAAWAKL